MTATMKANRIHMFGGPEVILFEYVPRPTPGRRDYAVQFARADLLDAQQLVVRVGQVLPLERLDRPTRCWRVCGRCRPAKSCSTPWATHNIAVESILESSGI